ncbi:hypothetical protein T265_12642 [Opisthorchis viverrini]|uniref:Uncharacterized protein n=1 Tax=Opisthorchis viverrini TaxID=6198 RepID=A0A075A0T4_OPIVI|nr:hypothetical protein T265_12642 [Opisthorchis viverrini]KER33323.1 hypothetical protein T265_12642 [Opisthorchis viverrini]
MCSPIAVDTMAVTDLRTPVEVGIPAAAGLHTLVGADNTIVVDLLIPNRADILAASDLGTGLDNRKVEHSDNQTLVDIHLDSLDTVLEVTGRLNSTHCSRLAAF